MRGAFAKRFLREAFGFVRPPPRPCPLRTHMSQPGAGNGGECFAPLAARPGLARVASSIVAGSTVASPTVAGPACAGWHVIVGFVVSAQLLVVPVGWLRKGLVALNACIEMGCET